MPGETITNHSPADMDAYESEAIYLFTLGLDVEEAQAVAARCILGASSLAYAISPELFPEDLEKSEAA